MLILASTTDKIEIVLGGAVSANQLHFNASFRDIGFTGSAETFLPGRWFGVTNNTTDASVIPSPGADTYRVIDYMSVYNADTAAATVTIKYDANGVERILWKVVVASTQVLQYTDGAGFQLLPLGGSGNEFIMDNITPPSSPAADKLSVFVTDLSSKMFLFYKSSLGFNTPLQEGIWETPFALWSPGVAAGTYLGANGANLGTAASVAPTTTNLYTAMRRSTFASVVTTANQQVGVRTDAQFYRGNVAGQGGFFFCCKFGLDNWTNNDRLFVGLCAGTTAVVTVQPSTLANTAGFCIEAGDTAITFLHNNAAGTGVKETIAGQPALADNQGYVAFIYAKPNDSVIYYRLDDMLTGATIIDTSINTELPVDTTMLCGQAVMGNAANVVVADARIGIGKLYVQTIN